MNLECVDGVITLKCEHLAWRGVSQMMKKCADNSVTKRVNHPHMISLDTDVLRCSVFHIILDSIDLELLEPIRNEVAR